MDEFSFIEYLKKKMPKSGRVSVGIGDDAAVLNVAKNKQLVVSTDVIVENIDFRRKTLSPEKIEKAKLLESVTAAAILQDKSQVLRGQPSTINMNVLADVLELMRAKRDQRPIGERSATSSLDL